MMSPSDKKNLKCLWDNQVKILHGKLGRRLWGRLCIREEYLRISIIQGNKEISGCQGIVKIIRCCDGK